MIVNGGAWTGSDGSSSGDAADRETTATAPIKTGTGKCNGVPGGNTFSVKDSNGEWIDGTNRLGETFYAKNGSGRVGLRRYAEEFGVKAALKEAGKNARRKFVKDLLKGVEND